ncbi:uncharacterized protein [Sinocyclocheilus grahami]|uniref:uncharacterized protein n=1 Tax=Sinocyclocheilus grahami TaxID=75366 RepID=UPI0007AD2E0E|nr:PREDICTED: uncharacterized protein LOC107557317 [Sinocyclocheilus grahami]
MKLVTCPALECLVWFVSEEKNGRRLAQLCDTKLPSPILLSCGATGGVSAPRRTSQLPEGRVRKQPRARINEASCAQEELQKSSAHLGNTSSVLQGIPDLTMLHIAVFSTACLILVGCIKAWLIHQIGMEEFVSISQENSTVVVPPKVATEGSPQNQMLKGLEGENCLRSSDCAEGLCCARHFWSKICKPVLKEGQVCTKHKRKGTHGLEIFQRCDCAEGLACRTQRDGSKSSRSLHTCQRH